MSFSGLNGGNRQLSERRREQALLFLPAKIARQAMREIMLASPALKFGQ
jgi:hypothetical protein